MTTLTQPASGFPRYEQTAETRGGEPHGRPGALSELSPIRFEFSFASLAVNIIRLRLRRHRRHHTTLREIFFRTPIGLGAPESITVKSTARDAPRRSAGQSLRRSRRAATPRLRLCGGCRNACVDSVFIRCVDFSPERRRIFGSLRHMARKPRYFKPRAIRLLRKQDTVAIRRNAF
jgi:hypothetical protein